jgi:hypothetical protein
MRYKRTNDRQPKNILKGYNETRKNDKQRKRRQTAAGVFVSLGGIVGEKFC